jgi:hypothetical protein
MEGAIRAPGEGSVVCHNDHGDLEIPSELRQQVVEHFSICVVQVPRRFISEEDRGVERQRARHSGALLLTARQLRGTVIRTMTEPDARQQFLGAYARHGRFLATNAQRHHHVLERRELAQQVVELEDEAHGAVPECRQVIVGAVGERLSREDDFTTIGAIERAEYVQQCALPGPTGSNNSDHLSTGDRQVDAIQHGDDTTVASAKRFYKVTRYKDTHQAPLPATASRNVTRERVAGHETVLMHAGGGAVSSLMANRL